MSRDLLSLAVGAVLAHRLRSFLSLLGIAIGIAAVILLTSIGEGTRRFMLEQFSQFGTNLLAINPGKSETLGVPGVLGGTTRKLSIADAEALARLPGIDRVLPVTFGTGRVEHGGLGRSVNIYGITPEMGPVWKFQPQVGGFWPAGDPERAYPMAILGVRLQRELFGDQNPLGRWVRIGGHRFRVVGVMEPKGSFLGMDLDDTAFVPVASAMRLFNQDELLEIDVLYHHPEPVVVERVRALLTARHGGNEDFTIITQEAMLEVFGNVMDVITMAVGAIAGISLVVGAVGILTMMWIAVGERTPEIGLLRALGATRRQVRALFLAEASALAVLGGVLGLAAGLGLGGILRLLIAGLPVHTPLRFVLAALAVSLTTGLLAGALPAHRAAALDPIEAL
ncbi:MAG TPA: ABC transporter permease, partial [Thermoanaerobaculia bacterium]|nr:ABC transporter permease [Thermoanaerobaculia bacterium]